MFKKSGNTLYITWGDHGFITLSREGKVFKANETVNVNIYRESEMNIAPIRTWTTGVLNTDTEEVTIEVFPEETELESPITEPTKYWWEATCGDETFIGYDEQGPKILNLYPGGISTEVDDGND